MRKIGEISTYGITFAIYYDCKAKSNKYRLYQKYWECGWKKKLLAKYNDLASCMAVIYRWTVDHNEESRPYLDDYRNKIAN